MARQIAKMLNGKEPKIVSGPEVLSKFVGETEANIRKLFEDAEKEYKEKGDLSGLHVVIFDEIDAICKSRGSRSDNTGTMDSLVNQLLAKIDGVEAINNLLLIGMTNRKDMLDEALLRPGRFEVQLEISLPNEEGRKQIFHIHLKKIVDAKALGDDVSIDELSRLSKNYTGAEIAGLIRDAMGYALRRKLQIDPSKGVKMISNEMPVVTWEDFTKALSSTHPAFAPTQEQDFNKYLKNGIIKYGSSINEIINLGTLATETVKNSPRTPLFKLLLSGKKIIKRKRTKPNHFPPFKSDILLSLSLPICQINQANLEVEKLHLQLHWPRKAITHISVFVVQPNWLDGRSRQKCQK